MKADNTGDDATAGMPLRLIYLDYLDFLAGHSTSSFQAEERLKCDLLLAIDSVLCLSVPACIKLASTAETLMQLTGFWSDGRIRPVLSAKHEGDPWSYFASRQKKLEHEFSEQQLKDNFEFKAYTSERTELFYSVYLPEVASVDKTAYLPRIKSADTLFREYSTKLAVGSIEAFSTSMAIGDAIRLNGLMVALTERASDERSLFQRSAIANDLRRNRLLSETDVLYLNNLLDRAFAYANADAAGAAPISFIRNRFTSSSFIPFISRVDPELRKLIRELSWDEVYRLSRDELWREFLDRLNHLLLCLTKSIDLLSSRDSQKLSKDVALSMLLGRLSSVIADTIREGATEVGVPYVQVHDALDEERARLILVVLFGSYSDAIRAVASIIPALKVLIKSLKEPYQPSRIRIGERGIEVAPLIYDD